MSVNLLKNGFPEDFPVPAVSEFSVPLLWNLLPLFWLMDRVTATVSTVIIVTVLGKQTKSMLVTPVKWHTVLVGEKSTEI